MPAFKLSLATAIVAALCCAAPAHAAKGNHHAVANFSSCAKPHYPKASLDAKHEGNVDLEFLIDESGAVKDAKIAKSSGYVPLDEAARDAIKLCKFTAATKNGKPVQEWTKVRYEWTLK